MPLEAKSRRISTLDAVINASCSLQSTREVPTRLGSSWLVLAGHMSLNTYVFQYNAVPNCTLMLTYLLFSCSQNSGHHIQDSCFQKTQHDKGVKGKNKRSNLKGFDPAYILYSASSSPRQTSLINHWLLSYRVQHSLETLHSHSATSWQNPLIRADAQEESYIPHLLSVVKKLRHKSRLLLLGML